MIRASLVLASLLIASSARAEDPSTPAEAPAEPGSSEAVPPAALRPVAEQAPLALQIVTAARSTGKTGLLLAAVARNEGSEDLLLLLSEAHVVPPDSTEADCPPESSRFRAAPVLQIRRSDEPGTQECADMERVPKADWALSLMRLRVGEAATIVVQVNAAVDWTGPLFAQLGVSYAEASDASQKEIDRAERLGLGFMVAGELPGGRLVAPGEGGARIQRAVELFHHRAISAPLRIEGTLKAP